jgi:hypothetical protein
MEIVMAEYVMKTDTRGRQRTVEKDLTERKNVVRVLPATDQIRRYLKHPANKVGFLAEGAAEWPNDAFTKRRIIEGDVRLEAAPAAPEPEPEAEQQAEVADKRSGAKAPEPAKEKPAKSES